MKNLLSLLMASHRSTQKKRDGKGWMSIQSEIGRCLLLLSLFFAFFAANGQEPLKSVDTAQKCLPRIRSATAISREIVVKNPSELPLSWLHNGGPSTVGDQLTDEQLSKLKRMAMDSPPYPPVGSERPIVKEFSKSSVILDVPTSTWTYGCSATSAGMVFGYYDRNGYPNMYTGSANGGVAPLEDLGQGIYTPIASACSIIATQNGFDGRTTRGHVDDYWISYGSGGPDPWVSNWPEHTWSSCTADYMGTNQWKWDIDNSDGIVDRNSDGSTVLWSSGAWPLYDYIPPASYGLPQTALCHGMRLFAESRDYTVLTNYTQEIDTQYPGGFSFAQYKQEIDAGRPVLIQVIGHTMVGVGYNDTTSYIVYLNDTWDNDVHQMIWGSSYANMQHLAVTVIHLAPVENCDDGIDCTLDTYDPIIGCMNTADDTLCDDGNACTNDTCNPLTGCVYVSVVCDDDDVCNGVETCDSLTGCVIGTPLDCDDGNACTIDSCDPFAGCMHESVDCDDGVTCTIDTCDPSTGCVYTPDDALCNDGDLCNGVEACDSLTGCVPGMPLDCDDGVACTEDICDPVTGCVHTADDMACDDGTVCNGLEACDPLLGCQSGTPLDCDDDNACTADSCDPSAGCIYIAVDCDDGMACTEDTCDPVTGCAHTPDDMACDDGLDCTVDLCNPVRGCVHMPDNKVCGDNNVCNGIESCDPVMGCVSGRPLDCSDGVDCTIDSCHPFWGCKHTPNNAACDDGNTCTLDSCDPSAGCIHEWICGEGEGEAPAEGEAEILPEGEGEVPAEGEGEVPAEGEGEVPIEGEGETPVEGEGELPVEGEGEVLPEGEGEILPEGEGETLVEGEIPVEGEGEVVVEGEGEVPAEGELTPVLSVTPASQEIDWLGGISTFYVETAATWTAISDATWVTLTSYGTANSTLTVYCPGNPGPDRTATITIIGVGTPPASATVNVNQSGQAVEGEGEPTIEGEGEAPAEGEGEMLVEGEGEILPEGEAPAEGEGEAPVEGEGESEEECCGCGCNKNAPLPNAIKRKLGDFLLLGVTLAVLFSAWSATSRG